MSNPGTATLDALLKPTIKAINVTINPSRTMAQLIADGNYSVGCANTSINERTYPMGPIPAGRELVRVRFHRHFRNMDEIKAARATLKIEAVTSSAYLLTVGAQQPDLKKEGPIMDIDCYPPFPDGSIACPALWFSHDHRHHLSMDLIDNGFYSHYWYLGLRDIHP